ncbi:MAG: hypothetical protein ACYC7D_04490 [Nitrososphaerales archaeon]
MPSENPNIYNIERKYTTSTKRIEDDATALDIYKKEWMQPSCSTIYVKFA